MQAAFNCKRAATIAFSCMCLIEKVYRETLHARTRAQMSTRIHAACCDNVPVTSKKQDVFGNLCRLHAFTVEEEEDEEDE